MPYRSSLETGDAWAENGLGIQYIASHDREILEDIVGDNMEEGGKRLASGCLLCLSCQFCRVVFPVCECLALLVHCGHQRVPHWFVIVPQ